MKFNLYLIELFLAVNVLNGQTNLYEHSNFDEIAKTHKIIGILPFETSISLRPKQMKDITTEQLDRMELAEGKQFKMQCIRGF